MSIPALEIPEGREELAAWLDGHLVGLQLAELVAGLEAVHGSTEGKTTLEGVCGDQLTEVLNSGVSVLDREQVRRLLRHPQLLLELHDRVIQEGGKYWQSVPLTEEHRRALDDGWEAIQARIRGSDERRPAARTPKPSWLGKRYRVVAIWSLTAAAALIVGVFIARNPQPAAGWGWDRPDALTADLSAPDYLNHLADVANEWFNKRPESREALATRLNEFRDGCDALIEAPHGPLVAQDRAWLIEKCRAWADKIDAHISALQQTDDVETVRSDADDTIRNLVTALRTRAASVA